MNDIKKALKTWYPTDHELHLEPLHPAIKLAGEAGELLDLYGKHKFKPMFDWWKCKHCGLIGVEHNVKAECQLAFLRGNEGRTYVPKVVDELGDWWYYWRILCYQDDYTALDICDIHKPFRDYELAILEDLTRKSLNVLYDCIYSHSINSDELRNAFRIFRDLLYTLEIPLNQVTEANFNKLNSEKTNHGWKGA